MICLINCHLQTYIFDGCPSAEPAGRKHQVYVDPFNIHISDARRWIALAKWIGPPMLMPLVAAHIFFVFRSILIGDSKPTLVMARAHQVRDRPFSILCFVLLKLFKLRPCFRGKVGLEQIGIRSYMGIRIKDFEAASHTLPFLDSGFFRLAIVSTGKIPRANLMCRQERLETFTFCLL